MTTTEFRRGIPALEKDIFASALQLRLAAGIVSRLIGRNGGGGEATEFWNEESFEAELDQNEYQDPELWDPDEDPVTDMAAEINENIFECL